MSCLIAPSILAADVACFGEQLKQIEKAGADYVHIDVMDGVFVPNISYGVPVVSGIRGCTELFFDVHLMIVDPIRYVKKFVEAGADGVTVHAEACGDGLSEAIDEIVKCGARPAVAISPDTPIDPVLPVLDRLYMVLVMTVHPGYGGQTIITETFDKIRALRKVIDERGLSVDIEVDGGITMENAREVRDVGANVFVAGTAVFRGDIGGNVKELKERLS